LTTNTRIARRITPLLLLALLLGLGGVSIDAYLDLRRATDRLNMRVQQLLLADRLAQRLDVLLQHETEVILRTGDTPQLEVERTLDSLEALLGELGRGARAEGSPVYVESLRRMTLTCREHAQRIFQLARRGKSPEAVAERDALERTVRFMREDLRGLLSSELERYSGMNEETRLEATRMAVRIISASCALLLASILVLALAYKRELRRSEQLNAELEHRVRSRTRELEETQRQLMDTAHLAGRAEVAVSVLHNVGNVLNSLNITTNLTHQRLSRLPLHNVARTGQLLVEHQASPGWLHADERGRMLPEFLVRLGASLERERGELLTQLREVLEHVEHIKHVVAMQQHHTSGTRVLERMALAELVEMALRLHAADFERSGVEVVRRYSPLPEMRVEKHKVLQILVNLISNACNALVRGRVEQRRLIVHLGWQPETRWHICVEDNGMGIAPEHLDKLFRFGFTTRQGGQGIGLHVSALAAQEMGGALNAHSDGPGRGAAFILEVPVG
jgi:C4-dicarboxylate-specific signal transduction histidine kinase